MTALGDSKRAGLKLLNRSIGRVVSDRLAGDYQVERAAFKYLGLSALVSRQMPPDLPLAAHELSVFSQNGEDGVLFELCRRLSVPHTFVEFGVGQGIQGNCVLLSDVFEWSGLFIEYDERMFADLRAKYGNYKGVDTRCEQITPQNVSSIFDDAGVDKEFGVLSIDIDGNDYWVWKALEDYRPAIVVIEYNSGVPADRHFVQPVAEDGWDGSTFFGASISAMEELANAKGYELVHAEITGVNAFFARSDLVANIPSGADVAHRGVNYFLTGNLNTHPASDRTDWESSS